MIEIDYHEPPIMGSYLYPIETSIQPLNDQGYADYKWSTHSGQEVHVERKTWGELQGSLDHVEAQLFKHLENRPQTRLILLLEGVATPNHQGTAIWREAERFFVQTYVSRYPMQLTYGWLYQIGKYIEVFHTNSFLGTAMALATLYKADQKETHTTFHRYLQAPDFHPNPQVAMFMGLVKAAKVNIGETKAIALVKQFGTVYNILTAKPEQLVTVDGIGIKTAKRLLQKLGRPDV